MSNHVYNQNDFLFDVAQGKFSNISVVHKFGRNIDIDITEEDVWDAGGTYVWATGAETVNVVSTDTNDTSAGTGARTVDIYGLDSSYNEISETITLNGTSNVESTNSYLRLFRMIVRTAGSGGENSGVISAVQSSSSVKMAEISIGNNQTLMAIYTIPAGKTGYIRKFLATVNKASSVGSNFYLRVRPENEVFQLKQVMGGHSQGATSFEREICLGLLVAEKSDIIISADSTGNNADVAAAIDIILTTN